MFKVRWNNNHEVVKLIYCVRTLDNGLLQFLTYDFGAWFWLPANEYSPLDYPVDYIGNKE